MIDRRTLLAALPAGLLATQACARGGGSTQPNPLGLADAEWRRRLSPAAYATLRQAATDPPYDSPFQANHRAGTYACAGCGLPDFSSQTKFESGTGWPSFWAPLPNSVALRTDRTLGIARTEVMCRRCGGHLGHVFDDGPKPTGKRYCMNGTALQFRPA